MVIATPSKHHETYVRPLQAKETLLDIRKFAAKAWLVEKCTSRNLEWIKSLRFFFNDEFVSLGVEKLEPAGMVLPRIEMRPVPTDHESYGTPEQIRELDQVLRKELKVPYNGPRFLASQPPPSDPGRTTCFIGAAAFSGALAQHNYGKHAIKPFGSSDALLFGSQWKIPPPPPRAASIHAPGTPATVETPRRWSPRVRMMKRKPEVQEDGSDLSGQGQGSDTGKMRPQSASALLRNIAAAEKQLDQYLSWRPGNRPPEYITNPESVRKSIADALKDEQHHVTPRRPQSARFHSARQIRTLALNAQDIAHRAETALRLQIVHAPGKTAKQRQAAVSTILKDPDIVGRLHLDTGSIIKHIDEGHENTDAKVTRSWRPSSGRPHRRPLPNYLGYDFE